MNNVNIGIILLIILLIITLIILVSNSSINNSKSKSIPNSPSINYTIKQENICVNNCDINTINGSWDSNSKTLKFNGNDVVLHGFSLSCTEYIYKGYGAQCFVNYVWGSGQGQDCLSSLDLTQLAPIISFLKTPNNKTTMPAIRIPICAAYYMASSYNSQNTSTPIDTSDWTTAINNIGSLESACQQYQAFICNLVNYFTQNNVIAILDLHWNNSGPSHEQNGYGNCSNGPLGQYDSYLPCNYAVEFWNLVSENYKNNALVWFEIYNEPMCSEGQIITQDLWLNGGNNGTSQVSGVCPTFVGMSQLYKTIRNNAPNNIIIVNGRDWAYSSDDAIYFEQNVNPNNVVYGFHPYQGLGQGTEKIPTMFSQYVTNVINSTNRPIICTELGQYCCSSNGACGNYNGTYNNQNIGYVQAILEICQSLNISWTAWAWTANQGCYYPVVNNGDSLYSPVNNQGADWTTLWKQYY